MHKILEKGRNKRHLAPVLAPHKAGLMSLFPQLSRQNPVPGMPQAKTAWFYSRSQAGESDHPPQRKVADSTATRQKETHTEVFSRSWILNRIHPWAPPPQHEFFWLDYKCKHPFSLFSWSWNLKGVSWDALWWGWGYNLALWVPNCDTQFKKLKCFFCRAYIRKHLLNQAEELLSYFPSLHSLGARFLWDVY